MHTLPWLLTQAEAREYTTVANELSLTPPLQQLVTFRPRPTEMSMLPLELLQSATAYWSLANHILFAAGSLVFFQQSRNPKEAVPVSTKGLFATTWLSLAGWASFHVFNSPASSALRTAAALALAAFATGLFAATVLMTTQPTATRLTPIYSEDKPEQLHQTGPFGIVRHPFYTSYIANFAACAMASAHHMPLVCLACSIVIYTRAASNEEGKFLQSSLADEYKQYQAKVPKLLPLSRKMRKPPK